MPVEHGVDGRRPPWMTLVLIALNILIFFLYQGGDEQHLEAAVKGYLQQRLLVREEPLYRAFVQQHRGVDPRVSLQQKDVDPLWQAITRRPRMAVMILTDLEFEAYLHRLPDYRKDVQWQEMRVKCEAERDKISLFRFGFIPKRFSPTGLVGAMFMHGDVLHLVGNMVFLFLFGCLLELALRRWVYLAMYLFSGVVSHLLWYALGGGWVPGVGASGAIAGLMGMSGAVYGLRRIRFFYWLGPLFGYFRAPALWIFPLWLGAEVYGLMRASDNVNYYAHIGGLAFGFVATWLFLRTRQMRVDDDYLDKVDPEQELLQGLATMDELIGHFDLVKAGEYGLVLLNKYPADARVLEKLYQAASVREDKALLTQVLRRVFALAPVVNCHLMQRMVEDGEKDNRLIRKPEVQRYLLPRLLRMGDMQTAYRSWQMLVKAGPVWSEDMPGWTWVLLRHAVKEENLPQALNLLEFLQSAFTDSTQCQQALALVQRLRRTLHKR